MSKRLFLAGAILLAACGPSSSDVASIVPGSPDQPGGDGQSGGIGLPILAETTTVKMVLKGNVNVPVQEYDGGTDSYVNVSCTADTGCVGYTGAACVNGLCQTQRASTIYVRNGTRNDKITVPCETGDYSAEVYGSAAAASPFVVTEAWSVKFSMAGCTPTLSTEGWTHPANPGLEFPATIYAGFGPPYDTFSVRVATAYPWWSPGWTVSYYTSDPNQTTSPTGYAGAIAMFTAPATAADLNFKGSVSLDRSLLIGSEAWTLPFTSLGHHVVASATVDLPTGP